MKNVEVTKWAAKLKRSNPSVYVYEIRGVLYLSWVTEIGNALKFTQEQARAWEGVLAKMARGAIEFVPAEFRTTPAQALE